MASPTLASSFLRRAPGLNALDPRRLAGRGEQQRVALAQLARGDGARDDPPLVKLVDILHWQAERHEREAGGAA